MSVSSSIKRTRVDETMDGQAVKRQAMAHAWGALFEQGKDFAGGGDMQAPFFIDDRLFGEEWQAKRAHVLSYIYRAHWFTGDDEPEVPITTIAELKELLKEDIEEEDMEDVEVLKTLVGLENDASEVLAWAKLYAVVAEEVEVYTTIDVVRVRLEDGPRIFGKYSLVTRSESGDGYNRGEVVYPYAMRCTETGVPETSRHLHAVFTTVFDAIEHYHRETSMALAPARKALVCDAGDVNDVKAIAASNARCVEALLPLLSSVRAEVHTVLGAIIHEVLTEGLAEALNAIVDNVASSLIGDSHDMFSRDYKVATHQLTFI